MPGLKRTPISIRLQRHVSIPDKNGCLLWMAAVNSNGYGVIGAGGHGNGMILAHRAAWELANGPIPKKLFVCHTCDVRSCINVSHLFLGTCADNLRDMVKKKRSNAGEKHHGHILTESMVKDIKEMRRSGYTQKFLGEKFGVNPTTIRDIIRGITWRHLLP